MKKPKITQPIRCNHCGSHEVELVESYLATRSTVGVDEHGKYWFKDEVEIKWKSVDTVGLVCGMCGEEDNPLPDDWDTIAAENSDQ